MKTSTVQARRRPRQSRAKITQQALQDSFVQLLHSDPAHKITIRQITDLAGVGLGTFYEYFSKKEDLIALTIHLHVKQHAEQVKSYAHNLIHFSTDLTFERYLSHIVFEQIQQIQRQQFLWSQIFALERQVSDIQSYRKSYTLMVNMWRDLLHPFLPTSVPTEQLALNFQRLSYGFVSQSLLMAPDFCAWQALCDDVTQLMLNLYQSDTQLRD